MHDDDDLSPLALGPHGRPRSSRPFSSRGAIYHLSVRTGTRSKNQSARAAAAYIQREQEYARGRAQEDELVYAESGHMPRWADAEPAVYWQAADAHERANGRLFKRVEMALPLALTAEERRELAVGFAHHLTDAERLPYTLALHAGKGTNPHCHLLISERGNDGIERDAAQWFKRYNAAAPARGGARKSTALHPKAWLEETRAAWAEQTNLALERAGHAVRIDHRSLEAQGSARLPGLHVGPVAAAMEKRGIATVRGRAAAAIARENAELARDRAEIERARAALNSQQEAWENERTRPEPERGAAGLAPGIDEPAAGNRGSPPGRGGRASDGPAPARGGAADQRRAAPEQPSPVLGAGGGAARDAEADVAPGAAGQGDVPGVEPGGVELAGSGGGGGRGHGDRRGQSADPVADVTGQEAERLGVTRWRARIAAARETARKQEEREREQARERQRARERERDEGLER